MTTINLHDALLPPGLLSLSRLPLALAFPFAWSRPAVAASVLAGAALTDVLDGFVARKLHQETETGALLDPLMDKTFVLGVAATLIASHAVTPLEATLLVTRDIVELPLVAYVMVYRVPGDRRANMAGKLTTVLQFTAAFAVALHVDPRVRAAVVGATALAGAIAGVTYWARALRQAKAKKKTKPAPRAAARARRSRAPSRRVARAA